ncbi:MAG: hypothetical protein BGO29_05565 [Bacteroidales bacterium 36-12]|nr:MAG: hypothetical protein BGO29_05565 [Bacteroidales bacterium 36-12]
MKNRLKKLLIVALLIVASIPCIHVNAQPKIYVSDYMVSWSYQNIYFKDMNTILLRYDESIRVFNIDKRKSVDVYSIDKELFREHLYIDDSVLFTKTALYHHNYFKDFKKIADINVSFKNEGKTLKGYNVNFLNTTFDQAAKKLIIGDVMLKKVFLIDAKTGEMETYDVPVVKNGTFMPLSANYVELWFPAKKKGDKTSSFMYNFKTQQTIYQSGYNSTPLMFARNCFPISDSIFLNRSEKFTYFTKDESFGPRHFVSPGLVDGCWKKKIDYANNYLIVYGGKGFTIIDLKDYKIKAAVEGKKSYSLVYPPAFKDDLLYYHRNTFDDITISPDGRYMAVLGGKILALYEFDTFLRIMEFGEWDTISYLKYD